MENSNVPQDLRWRLILGKDADPNDEVPMTGQLQQMDQTLEALYNSDRRGNLGSSSPKINRWLGDIRKYFPASVVQVMQKDALERLGLERMLLEPELLETITPDVQLVGQLLSLKQAMPSKTKETARQVVHQVVEDLRKRLKNPLREAVEGALSRAVRNHRPKLHEIDWPRTIRRNLKHYQPEYKSIIPQNLIGYGRRGQALRDIILCVDQSGSMSSSVVYASIFAAVLASLPSVRTQLVLFDTEVVDMSHLLNDPIELLFGTQLGGGTNIHKALTYAEQLVQRPQETIMVLISDLYEGGNRQSMLQRVTALKQSGVHMISLLALDDKGTPSYDRDVAKYFAQLDIPTFACTPNQFPELMSAAIQKHDLRQWLSRQNIEVRN